MSVTIDKDPYVLQPESKLFDVVLDLRGGFHKSTVEQEMTLWRRN